MIAKKNISNVFVLFLLLHLTIWTLVPTLSNVNLPLDTIEALAWGSDLDWGFNKHPPMSALFVEMFYQIFGTQDWAVKYGCSCHNNGAPSDRAVVMVTGVPLVYEPSQQYQLTIKVADSLTLSGGEGNVQAGFLMSTDAIGNFSWDESEDIRYADGRQDDISHSEPDLDGTWLVNWQAPSEDVGPIQFWLVGNSVDGGGSVYDLS